MTQMTEQEDPDDVEEWCNNDLHYKHSAGRRQTGRNGVRWLSMRSTPTSIEPVDLNDDYYDVWHLYICTWNYGAM